MAFQNNKKNWVVATQICFIFHPDPWGFMIQFDLRIFFKWVGEKPPTRKTSPPHPNQPALKLGASHLPGGRLSGVCVYRVSVPLTNEVFFGNGESLVFFPESGLGGGVNM